MMTISAPARPACAPGLLLFVFMLAVGSTWAQTLPRYDHIVIVIDENKNDTEIRGNTAMAPYINGTLIPNSANFTAFVAETHPSQPNYIQFFSGAQQGILQDGLAGTSAEPGTLAAPPPFTTVNLGRELLNAGKTFAIYSETLPPSVPGNRMVAVDPATPGATIYGYTGEIYNSPTNPQPAFNQYARKHNPASNWQRPDASAANNGLPETVNQPFSVFGSTPADFAKLPDVCIVVPDERNDMHDGPILQGDQWLQTYMEPYRQWALTHNSLFIYTFDESDLGELQQDPTNQIITVVSGARVVNGNYPEAAIAQFRISDAATPETAINHYNLTDTIETIEGTAHDVTAMAQSTNPGVMIKPITDLFSIIPVVSRKVHGGAGAFDLALPTTGTPATEPRVPGANNGYQLVYTFPVALSTVGSVAVTQGAAAVASTVAGPDANQVTVNLTGVTNAQRLVVTLNQVRDTAGNIQASIPAYMNVLIGDVDGSGRTDSGDVTILRNENVQPVNQSNFLFDVNLSGRIDSGDVTVTRAYTVTALPAQPAAIRLRPVPAESTVLSPAESANK